MEEDQSSRTLKLIAFIFALLETISLGISTLAFIFTNFIAAIIAGIVFILVLLMTIHIYNASKGEKYSLLFAIVSLLILGIVPGILLIVDYASYESKKDNNIHSDSNSNNANNL